MSELQGGPFRSPMMRAIRGLDRGIGWLEDAVLIVSILFMATLNIVNVLGNNLKDWGVPFVNGLSWAVEINQALLVIITFVGVAKGARHGRNIRMSAIYDQLRGKWRKGLNIVITTGSAAVMFYLAYYAFLYEAQVRAIGQSTPSLGIPLWVLYIAVPAGLFLTGVQYSLTTVRNLTEKEVYRSFAEREVYEEADLAAVEARKLEEGDDRDASADREGRH
ncbi:MAG: TRAP transporter small permease [Guyparkeria sp.]